MAHCRCSRLLVLLLAAATFLGCEENLAPRTHFNRSFTVYGVLSPQLPTQSIRVYAIENIPTLGSDSIDAVVTSRDLTTGEIRTWNDSAIVDPNGQYEHVFWSPFRAEYGHRYHVEIIRTSDRARAFADVRVPPPVTVRVDASQSPNLYVTIEGENIQANKPEIVYIVQKFSPEGLSLPILAYPISYEGQQQHVASGSMVHVPMHHDRPKVQSWYNLDAGTSTGTRCNQLTLRDMRLRTVIGDSAWNPPGGILDPKILNHPGLMSNVEGGFGFVGAGYRIDEDIDLSREAVEKACFLYFNPTG